MKESLVCRDYTKGDEHRILALFREVFGAEMSLPFWQWRFIEPPFGKGIIKLLFDGNKLIGHYAVIPMDVQVQGKLLKAVFSMTTMTHPDYSDQGIFTYLAEDTYKLCRERGFNFVYGFPNRNSYSGFVRKLQWQDLGKMAILEKKLQPVTTRGPIRAGFSINEVENFDTAINSLWDKVKQEYVVIVPRTEQFLNWRFVRNPDVRYTKYTALDSYGNVLGYVVLKIYVQENITRGHIVDVLTVSDEEVVCLLLDNAYAHFLKNGVGDVSCWIPQNSFYADVLKEEGFVRKETDTYFGVRSFSEDDILIESIGRLSAWYITMGDSDVF